MKLLPFVPFQELEEHVPYPTHDLHASMSYEYQSHESLDRFTTLFGYIFQVLNNDR